MGDRNRIEIRDRIININLPLLALNGPTDSAGSSTTDMRNRSRDMRIDITTPVKVVQGESCGWSGRVRCLGNSTY